MWHTLQTLISIAGLVFFVAVSAISGQTIQQPPEPPALQSRFPGDPVRQLNLSPEQREQIRSIREQSRDERAAVGERLRQTNHALEEALDAENPDEAVIEQRMREVAAAQAAAMRMRILTEVRIRRVLTMEQRNILRTLRQQARELRRERPLNIPDERRRRREERSLRLQNKRNDVAPLFPRRDAQRRPRPSP